MRIALYLAALSVFIGMSASSRADGNLLTVESQNSVTITADRIVAILKDKGVGVAARIDHAAAAKAAGLSLPDTQVILFGNPRLGTPLMVANPEIAIDLPMRMLVWQAADGKVLVGYTPPSDLLAKHGLAERKEAIEAMTKVLGAVAQGSAFAQ